MSNGKKKGAKAERDLCKWWQMWTGFDFTRVPASGGLRWKGLANATTGDLICANERHGRRFQFSVESKSYKDINFEHLILGNKKIKVKEFWEQAKEDGLRANKIPILFMRYNGMSKNMYFVMIPEYVYSLFTVEEKSRFFYPEFFVNRINNDENTVILNSQDLLEVDYLNLHKNLKKLRRNG